MIYFLISQKYIIDFNYKLLFDIKLSIFALLFLANEHQQNFSFSYYNTLYLFWTILREKIYNIKKVQSQPKIDGKLNEPIWNNLDIAKNFSQIEPNNGKAERKKQKTEVKICYDNKNIYFGIMMYDNAPDSILKELSKRDEENKNFDAFGIFIDPFNNSQVEYNFMVTAAGVQIDRKFTKTGIDKTWNAVWKSAVDLNNKGWIAEISIPFSQIRFPDNNQPWALNMAREIRRYRETYSWNPINVKYNDFSLQAGLLDGIKNLTPQFDSHLCLMYQYTQIAMMDKQLFHIIMV